MNILIINGSKKGFSSNTMKITNAFLEGVKKKCAVTVNAINLSDADIKMCKGCFSCWADRKTRCVIKDDMENIRRLIDISDLIIWNFGLRVFNIPSLLSVFMERFIMPLRFPYEKEEITEFGKKQHVIVCSASFNYDAQLFKTIESYLSSVFLPNFYYGMFISQGEMLANDNRVEKSQTSILEKIKERGSCFVEFPSKFLGLREYFSIMDEDTYNKYTYQSFCRTNNKKYEYIPLSSNFYK